jgi:D-glycero-alpha-D-manno-heptose-7-phosphate kinase
MIGALATWAKGDDSQPIEPWHDGELYIEIVRDIETTVIQVPAGMQDYYGAMYGGLQSLRWGAGTHSREHLPNEVLTELEDRLLLFYSGQSRNSGINNWALFKGFIDGQDGVRSKFEKIATATTHLETALRARDWAAVGRAIAEEWDTRRTLAPGITTPEMDQAFKDAAKIAPISGKVCGAGGGGCFFVYIPTADAGERAEQKQQIIKALTAGGLRSLPFRAVPHGLEVQVGRA